MTGFAYETFHLNKVNYTLEIKTVNSRYLDIKINLPENYSSLEMAIQKILKKHFSRGRISLTLKESIDLIQSETLRFNYELIERYLKEVKLLKNRYHLREDLSLEFLLQLPNVITFKKEQNSKNLEISLLSYVENICNQAVKSREDEGERLKDDLLKRSHYLRELLLEVDKQSAIMKKYHRKRISERIQATIDNERIEDQIKQEIALLIEKGDITEEITRLESHLKLLETTLHQKTVIGRKLEFIIQEIQREINTVGSKSNDALLSEYVIEFKGELERIREQIQNIE